MKVRFTFSILLLLTICISVNVKAQNFLQTQGTAIVNEAGDTIILRGMGLGGWMLQEGYMLQTAGFATAQYQIKEVIGDLIGEANTEIFYEEWLANHCTRRDIDSLKSWGFNSVRLPMHYNLFTLPIEDEPVAGEHTWLTKGFELTDSLISWCAQNEMWVVLDMHACPGGQGYDQAISDYNPDKPSLWESEANRNKLVALWQQIADRYKDEQWVAAYDLINEPNWDMPGGVALRSIYNQIIDAIRLVDPDHIVIIEGNWFANDFTGLTPPWTDNFVYGPHKYWSFNNPGDLDWVTSIRDQYNVPLYFGESGENSNTWFRDAIHLIESEGIGWAWWPMKKVESISGPLSITKSAGYTQLLDYWSGNGSQPTAIEATNILMQFVEDIKIENCTYQKDVIDAMFRQVQTDEVKPYNTQQIPGVVYASDYDMGRNGFAYYDNDVANYSVSSGTFTTWNAGWAYRNDGVDIEVCSDAINANGYNVGFIEEGEWMQYDIEVANEALYDIELRTATSGTNGSFKFSVDGSDITNTRYVPVTGGFQTWGTITVPNVILSPENSKLKFHSIGSGFNVSSFEFIEIGPTTDIACTFLSATTVGLNTVELYVNKTLESPLPPSPADFEIFANGNSLPILETIHSNDNTKIISFVVDHTFNFSESVTISYAGNSINATDGTTLETFSFEEVTNNSLVYIAIPAKIQAEDYAYAEGVVHETCYDTGGGENIGYLDVDDFVDYYINVPQTGSYNVAYRVASDGGTGAIQMQNVDEDGSSSLLHNVDFWSTGDWQNFVTVNKPVWLQEGQQQIRLLITQPLFNLNWFEFSLTTSIDIIENNNIHLYPNPAKEVITIEIENFKEIKIFDIAGKLVYSNIDISSQNLNSIKLDISKFNTGTYLLVATSNNEVISTQKIFKY